MGPDSGKLADDGRPLHLLSTRTKSTDSSGISSLFT